MKKCPVGGFGTVDARIPFSQSVACGPTMEMRPLLGSRAVDGPALTRDATAGGSFGIEDEKVRSRLRRLKPVESDGTERRVYLRSDHHTQSRTPVSSTRRRKRSISLYFFVFSTRLPERFLTMSATCEPLLEALKDCLMRSDCVLKKGKLPSECLRQHTDELPDACKSLRHAVFECKRGLVSSLKFHRIRYGLLMETGVQVDMRKRFRGNQAAIMVSPGYKCPMSDAYPTLLTGQRIAREKKGRGRR